MADAWLRRGGGYSVGAVAGPLAVAGIFEPSATGIIFGFRCVR